EVEDLRHQRGATRLVDTETLIGVVVDDGTEIERPRPPGAVKDVWRGQGDVVVPGLPVPFPQLSPGSARVEMQGDKGQRRLRQIRDAVRDHQVAGKAE